jgi:hypothetical protein
MSKQTFTLTFGNQAENHKGMQIIGKDISEGLNSMDIDEIVDWVESENGDYELIYLNDLLEENEAKEADDAFLLIVKDGLNLLMGDKKAKEKLYLEQEKLEKDKKAWMYGRVVDKKARHNLCFSDFSQEADFEEGKGTVINFKDLPQLKKVRARLGELLENKKLENLQCEGNYYYDIDKTFIGWHGDSERKIVVATRLGADFPIYFRWYQQGEEKGKILKKILKDGDLYFMSDKAVGHDWKKKKVYTLRHAAGFEKALKMKVIKEEEKEKDVYL